MIKTEKKIEPGADEDKYNIIDKKNINTIYVPYTKEQYEFLYSVCEDIKGKSKYYTKIEDYKYINQFLFYYTNISSLEYDRYYNIDKKYADKLYFIRDYANNVLGMNFEIECKVYNCHGDYDMGIIENSFRDKFLDHLQYNKLKKYKININELKKIDLNKLKDEYFLKIKEIFCKPKQSQEDEMSIIL